MPRKRVTNLDELASFATLDRLRDAPGLAGLFPAEGPIELEVGPGKGMFIADAAAEAPGVNFLGIEIAKKYAALAAARVAKRGLSNAVIVAGDVKAFFDEVARDDQFRAIHIYFPDPWWKARHHKRRVIGARFLDHAARTVERGGHVHFRTDVEAYHLEVAELFGQHPAFVEVEPPIGRATDDAAPVTNFERKFRIEGRPIFARSYAVRK